LPTDECALKRRCRAVDQPEDAIKGADIAMCASNSLDNIFFERWVEEGMHLSSIKQPEIEMKALKRPTASRCMRTRQALCMSPRAT